LLSPTTEKESEVIAPGDDVVVAVDDQREVRGSVLSMDGGWLKVTELRLRSGGRHATYEQPTGNVWTYPWPWWEEPTYDGVRVELRSRLAVGLVPPKVW